MDEAEEVVKSFKFAWPGKTPEDKEAAEQGIAKLFMLQRGMEESPIIMEVTNDRAAPQSSDLIDQQVEGELAKIDNKEIEFDEKDLED